MKSPVLVSLILTLLVGAASAGEPKTYTVGKDGLKIEGQVNHDDPLVKIIFAGGLPHDLPAKSFDVKLAAGKIYQLAMNSKAIDSVLAIQDKTGKQIAYDDDGAGFPNALLSFTPTKDDTYRIFTASLKDAGPFTLLISEQVSILNVSGQINGADAKVKVMFDAILSKDLLAKPFEVNLAVGKTYRMAMTSKQLNALLIVHDKTGKQVAIDNGRAFPDAILLFAPPRNDSYKIYAVAEAGTGDFNLLVTEEKSNSLVREVNAGLRIDGRLDQFLKTATYPVKLVAGKTYVIDMARPAGALQADRVEPILVLRNGLGSMLTQNDSLGKTNARIVYHAPSSDVYQVEATSYLQKANGKFMLSIREKSPEILGTFQDGIYKAQGDLSKEDPRDELLTKSPQKAYSLRLAAGKRYGIDLESRDFDAFLRLEDSMGNQVALDDDSGAGSNARIIVDANFTGQYRIVVTNLDQKTGGYTLTVRQR